MRHGGMRFGASVLLVASVLGTPAQARKHADPLASGLHGIRLRAAAPDFSYDTGAGAVRLSALAGRVVVLNFWATWCEPCRAELDAFVRLRAAFGQDVALVTVSGEAPGVARTFLATRHVELPVAEDPTRKIFAAYSVDPIPVTLVLGRDRTVRHVSVGQLDWPELETAVEAAQNPLPAF